MGLIEDLKAFLHRVESVGGEVRELRADPPASEEDVARVEAAIGLAIPSQLRHAMTTVSAHLDFGWSLKESIELPAELDQLFAGELHWGLDLLPGLLESYRGWVRDVFPNHEDAYDRVWHDKFPFQEVGNGDVISIDEKGAVVYLSHDDGEGHGFVMATGFDDLLSRWVPLGCAGGEDWQWLPFTRDMTTRIDPQCDNALTWMRLLGAR